MRISAINCNNSCRTESFDPPDDGVGVVSSGVGTVTDDVGEVADVGVGHDPKQFGEGTSVTGVAVAIGAVVATGTAVGAAVGAAAADTMTVPCIKVCTLQW